jgi:aromatic ring-opening dioxygenase catalytic subunit (LigB family)
MAKLVGVFAASHAPLIVRNWQGVTPVNQTALTEALTEMGRRMNAAKPDVIIEIAPDHWVNFFINNLPSILVGVGEEHEGPGEPWMKDFPHRTLAGHPKLAQHILETAFEHSFEPSQSHHLTLDHGFCIPLWKSGLNPIPPIVPIVFNDLEPPYPTVKRCYAWGQMLADAIKSYPEDIRVAVLATGGLSHSIGEATMGVIEEEFDHECIRQFEAGDNPKLLSFLHEKLPTIGNGAAEIRNWVAAHGAAGGSGFELLGYANVPEVYVGCGFAAWNLGSEAGASR